MKLPEYCQLGFTHIIHAVRKRVVDHVKNLTEEGTP